MVMLKLQERSTPMESASAVPATTLPDLLPRLPIAICPYCGQIYSEAMSLEGSGLRVLESEAGSMAEEASVCKHFGRVHHFLVPEDRETPNTEYGIPVHETPFVVGLVLDERIKSHAVMNKLPMFRVNPEGRLTRFQLFTFAYYAETPYQLSKVTRLMEKHLPADAPLRVPASFETAGDEWRDLASWVARERLSWLEKSASGPKRRAAPEDQFPHA